MQVRDPVYGSSNSDLKITFDLVVTAISPEEGQLHFFLNDGLKLSRVVF